MARTFSFIVKCDDQAEIDRFWSQEVEQVRLVYYDEAFYRKLAREFVTAQTPYGEVTVKIGRLDGRVVQAAPEFDEGAFERRQQQQVQQLQEARSAHLPPGTKWTTEEDFNLIASHFRVPEDDEGFVVIRHVRG